VLAGEGPQSTRRVLRVRFFCRGVCGCLFFLFVTPRPTLLDGGQGQGDGTGCRRSHNSCCFKLQTGLRGAHTTAGFLSLNSRLRPSVGAVVRKGARSLEKKGPSFLRRVSRWSPTRCCCTWHISWSRWAKGQRDFEAALLRDRWRVTQRWHIHWDENDCTGRIFFRGTPQVVSRVRGRNSWAPRKKNGTGWPGLVLFLHIAEFCDPSALRFRVIVFFFG